MDATVAQILLGVATNVFSATLERSVDDAFEVDVETAIEDAVRKVAARSGLGEGLDPDRLAAFLEGPEVAATLRMLFISVANEEPQTRAELEAEFAKAFEARFTGQPPEGGRELFDALLKVTEAALRTRSEEGSAEAAEVLGSYRFGYVKEELAGLKASIDDLKRSDQVDPAEVDAWERLYRGQVQARHGTIVPPSLDTAERVPIDEIYLTPSFTTGGDIGGVDFGPVQLANNLSRGVVLGDPGAGKSTFATKLAFDLAREEITLPGGALIPFLVDLKEYGAEKHRSRISIAEWLESIVSSDYNAPAPSGAISYLLASGRAAMIFDGLDELLDTSHRKKITADIETFASRFVAAPILVTSRRVGYRQAPLDPRRFVTFGLSDLDEGQVKSYVSTWFGRRHELPEKAREEMTRTFLKDSAESAGDLRRNMLMLGLLCNLYRGEGHIPRHRPQVYEKCAVMLFERWDKGRRIVVELEFERHLRPAMQHLAYWIYSDPSLRGGVTEAQLVKSTTGFLHERRFEDIDKARGEAHRFVEFCSGRAWVFTDTGTTADGDRLYQFTHRTFLEFFAAEHLVRTRPTPEALLEVLLPRIGEAEWDEVAQLAFQLQDENIDGAADELLAGLIEGEVVSEEQELLYGFAVRALAFLVPRRETCRAVARAAVERLIVWMTSSGKSWISGRLTESVDLQLALVRVDRENFRPVSLEMLEQSVRFLAAEPEDPERAVVAAEIALNGDIALRGTTISPDAVRAFTAEAADRLWPLLEAHAETNPKIAYDGYWCGKLGIEAFLAAHSTESLWDGREFKLYGARYRPAPIELMFDGQFGDLLRPGGATIGDRDELKAVGAVLEETPPPWDLEDIKHGGLLGSITALTPREDLKGPALFGGFAMLAWTAEQMFKAEEIEKLLPALAKSSGWVQQLRPYLLHRFVAEHDSLPPLDCDEGAAILVDTWARGGWSTINDYEDLGEETSSMREGLVD